MGAGVGQSTLKATLVQPKELLAFGGECILLCWWSTHPGVAGELLRGALVGGRLEEQSGWIHGEQLGRLD